MSHETGKIKAKFLLEVSGVAASLRNPGVLWMHNDGDSKHVYAIKTSGKLLTQVVVDVPVEDAEDIAIGPGPEKDVDYIYLGDIGDNDARRREIRVIRIAEPALADPDGRRVAASTQVFRLTYIDGPHDAEALMIDPVAGDLIIATKGKKETRVYATPLANLQLDGLTKLNLLAILPMDNVSAGDISRDGGMIVLRREETGWLWNRARGESLKTALARRPQTVPVLGDKQAKNGEAIAFAADGRGYFTVSEGRERSIYRFDLPAPPGP